MEGVSSKPIKNVADRIHVEPGKCACYDKDNKGDLTLTVLGSTLAAESDAIDFRRQNLTSIDVRF